MQKVVVSMAPQPNSGDTPFLCKLAPWSRLFFGKQLHKLLQQLNWKEKNNQTKHNKTHALWSETANRLEQLPHQLCPLKPLEPGRGAAPAALDGLRLGGAWAAPTHQAAVS